MSGARRVYKSPLKRCRRGVGERRQADLKGCNKYSELIEEKIKMKRNEWK